MIPALTDGAVTPWALAKTPALTAPASASAG
jgi:hypothetical protein